MAVIQLRGVSKAYDTPAGPFIAVRDIDRDVGAGELIGITGKSGSGKSTLLNVIAAGSIARRPAMSSSLVCHFDRRPNARSPGGAQRLSASSFNSFNSCRR